MDELDDQLKNRIKEVFDNFEDTSADEGWLLLREKFPEKRDRRGAFIWMWWGAAAIVLVFLGILLWMKNAPDKPENHIVKVINHPKQEKLVPKKVIADTLVNNVITAKKKTTRSQSAQNQHATILQPTIIPANPFTPTTGKPAAVLPVVDTTTRRTLIAKNNQDSVKSTMNKAPQMAANTSVPTTTNKTPASVVPPPQDKPKSLVIQDRKPAKDIIAMFKDDNGTTNKKDIEDAQSKKVRFGVYAATYFNYSKGSSNQMNVGAGVTSDIPLTNNLKLVTGISVGQNSLSYSAVPSEVYSSSNARFVPAALAAPAKEFMALSTPTVKNYNASLIGLDVPVNLKYEFNPQKTDAYFSLGLSSGTFIDETYTYKYNYPSLASSTLQQTKDESTGTKFNNFYFAKTLNVAFGIGYPFGGNRLIIEPFLKYPLDGMGSQNLRFGSGGLNLKFNFLSQPKHK
ncbi:MAG: PorT family protein [Bacteroidota bacterium]|nr:PorT family protein [Bacteroidota bacterium]